MGDSKKEVGILIVIVSAEPEVCSFSLLVAAGRQERLFLSCTQSNEWRWAWSMGGE